MLREVELRKERWLKAMAAEKMNKKTARPSSSASSRSSSSSGSSKVGSSTRAHAQVNPKPSSTCNKKVGRAGASQKEHVHRKVVVQESDVREEKQSNQVTGHMESYMASQLMSHACPLCYELMKGEKRAPIIVFPCGHTFCATCKDRYCERNGCCPVCRTEIGSAAVNHSLKQVIESFLESRTRLLESSSSPGYKSSFGSTAATSSTSTTVESKTNNHWIEYSDKLSSLYTRIDILENQRTDIEQDLIEAGETSKACAVTEEALKREETMALKALEQAQRQLELVRKHMNDQRTKQTAADSKKVSLQDKLDMVQQSLASLKTERDKIKLLMNSSK